MGYSIAETRVANIDVRPQKALYWRTRIANENGSSVFLSFHLNGGCLDDKAFAVYQQGQNNEDNSIELGKEIMNNLSPYFTIDPENCVVSVKGHTRYNDLAVLTSFHGKAGILIEFGCVGSKKNITTINNNINQIGHSIAKGIDSYMKMQEPLTQECFKMMQNVFKESFRK